MSPGERPVAGEEFASIMRNQTLGLPGRFETLDALERAAVQSGQLRLPRRLLRQLRAQRARARRSGAGGGREEIHPAEEVIWIVVGDLRKVEAGIRELNYGDVVRLDTDGRTTTDSRD